MNIKITIDENFKCKRCGKGGAVVESGYCMGCINKNLKEGKYDNLIKLKAKTREEQI